MSSTEVEDKILMLNRNGHTNREIADMLRISACKVGRVLRDNGKESPGKYVGKGGRSWL